MTIEEFMRDHVVLMDGAMGTSLQAAGLAPGEYPERWNITHPEVITRLHREYLDAGSNVILSNTFGANPLKFSSEELHDIVLAAVANARQAQRETTGAQEAFVGLDVGPLGRLLKPFGDLPFEDAVSAFAEVIRFGDEAGADLIFIETMNDSYETKAALLAAKENSDLPVWVSNAYTSEEALMTGATPEAMVCMLEGMHAQAIGANCSLGPDQLEGVITRYLARAQVPVILKPNAGMPRSVDGRTVYDVGPEEFAESVARMVERGVRIAGGCCGTTPVYIAALARRLNGVRPRPIAEKAWSAVSSYTRAVDFGQVPVLIGERINPTGKKRLQQALRDRDIDYLLNEGLRQQDAGAQVLDVNVGLPGIPEADMLTCVVEELQAVSDAPLQLDTSDARAMEAGLRVYNGKAMVNSVNGKAQVMDAVFPLVAKYGGLVVALTIDEDGIPATADGRVAVARKILARAADFGITKRDIIFDPLAMTISADAHASQVTLEAVRRIHDELGALTSLGISNVSFGLPARDELTSTFFALCLDAGLSAAIMNPYSLRMMSTYTAFKALSGKDDNCLEYLAFAQAHAAELKGLPAAAGAAGAAPAVQPGAAAGSGAPAGQEQPQAADELQELRQAVVRGMKDKARTLTRGLLQDHAPLELVQRAVIPALNIVGEDFEAKRIYLPQLLMAAEASQAAFEEVKARMATGESTSAQSRYPIIIATVKGDIHDIGKNIVKLLLENYGFAVHDLGKDVPAERILEEVCRTHAPLVGLSALMTTTVPAMQETIELVHKQAPWARVVVGGAVLTPEYAARIGADAYCKDAMETVRYAEALEEELNRNDAGGPERGGVQA